MGSLREEISMVLLLFNDETRFGGDYLIILRSSCYATWKNFETML